MAKTEYKFKCNKNVAENIIMQFLKANNYKELVTKDGKKYYKYSKKVFFVKNTFF